MKEQRERAKADAQAKKTGHAGTGAYREIADKAGATDFVGYSDTESESTIVGILVDGASSPAATEGDEVEIVLDRTPSTPRAAARSVTPAGSRSTPAPSSRSATARSRSRACTSTRASSRSAR